MELTQQLTNILTPILEIDNYFIVDIKASISKLRSKITVLVDSDTGIGIDDLGKISRAIETQLEDIMTSAYTLEVSSPGVDTPLTFERMYRKNIGRTLNVKLNDETTLKGKLMEANSEFITLLPDKLKKQKEQPAPLHVAYSAIKEAKVVVSFK